MYNVSIMRAVCASLVGLCSVHRRNFRNGQRPAHRLRELPRRHTMAPKKTDFYERLGVAKDADETAIKKAYRTLALKHHPDKGGDPETFKLYAEVRATCFKPEDAPCGCCMLLTRWLRLAGVRCAVGRGETSRVRRHWRRRARRLRH